MRRIATFALVVLSGVALAAGCSNARRDQALINDVKAAMFSDPQMKSSNVEVVVKNGEATLTGQVPEENLRNRAFYLALSTPGIRRVIDQLTVQAEEFTPAAELTPIEPAPIQTVVRQRVASSTKLNSSPVAASSIPSPAPEAPPAQLTAVPPITPPPPPPPQPKHVEIPAGTSVRIQMIDGVDSEVNHTGESFRAQLDSPIVIDNEVVVPAGTDAYVKLVSAKSAGRMTGQSELRLELVRLDFQGKSYALSSTEYEEKGSSRGKRTAVTIGGGAAIGAIIGGAIGGGKGAAIGAATGAGGGTAVQAATKGQQVRVPSEARLDFTLEQTLEVTYFPEKDESNR